MVLSMDSYGSYGNEDIYISKRRGNTWTRPLNLGATINTVSQELSPAITSNADTLYFSTNSAESEKGIEVFFSKRMDDSWGNWSKPKLLGSSEMAGMDMYYLPVTKRGRSYFTNTQTSDGFGNIYFNGNASVGPSSKGMIDDPVNRADKEELNNPEIQRIDKPLPLSNDLKETEQNQVDRTVDRSLAKGLDTLAVGKALILEKLLFQRGSVELVNKESLTTLDELSAYMIENSGKIISIEGHTDSYGNEDVNSRLSLARANKIKEFLLEKGVPKERLLTKGWGGKKPIATNSNLAGRIKNRRVELFVLSKESIK